MNGLHFQSQNFGHAHSRLQVQIVQNVGYLPSDSLQDERSLGA